MTLIRRAALTALVLTLASTGAVLAGSEGRVIATVVDETGAPLEGAKVLVTRPGANYKLEKTSDRKGQVTLLILDASHEYQVRVEKAGYKHYEGPVKPKMEDTMRLTFNLAKDVPAPAAEKELSGNDKAILAYNDGVTALRDGDIAAAAPKLQEAASLDPNLAETHAALAEVYLEMKRNGEALAAADRYLALRPGDARGLRARYDALKAAGDDEKAREALEALGTAGGAGDPETAVRFFNQGAELARTGKLDEAASFFQKVVEIAPNDAKFAKAHYVMGLNLAKDESKKAEARRYLESFLELAPNDPDAKTAQEMLEYLK
ncbi:MAG TPA: carboxypeptidase regulatory-like domain-containing protein [Thermoanaerobaculia bacterium]|nr:carboxypeptidase regulatory-like domain-containing protein [Thermoanaerobaculia bacterium]